MLDWAERMVELSDAEKMLARNNIMLRDIIRTQTAREKMFYAGRPDFLLRHGFWYQPTPWTGCYPKGLPRQCFQNALALAITEGLDYVEGVAIGDIDVPLDVPHAWNTNASGELIDSTWINKGRAYLGVRFSLERVWNCLESQVDVLDNYADDYALFRVKWMGEPAKFEPLRGLSLPRKAERWAKKWPVCREAVQR